ncbi:hypothetical protein FRD01_12940 [Microvenator marinus]|uniref:Mercuric transport protein MerT n=1 Tax=Microvenator marinus TaxID=2600177 RepID=A0A5B8XR72_9DELT|nr:hypothetical protein FRD01_12940 [Microvenator marinus]
MSNTNQPTNDDSSERWAVVGSVMASIGAAVCCLGPMVLVSLGVTGAWIGSLSALEPYRPILMIIAAGLLGYGFYRVYGKSKRQQACGEDDRCKVPKANRINKISLWIATAFVGFFLTSPYLLGLDLSQDSLQLAEVVTPNTVEASSTTESRPTEQVTLDVSGMTCAGCTHTVASALDNLDGVEKATVSFEPPRAHVTYDPDKVTPRQLTAATENVGYPSTVAK